ncbi:hypothetical protein ACFRLW_38070, partial [Streptomyces sp. NPDC056728]
LYCPQQVLVRNLTDLFLRDGGDLRYEAVDVSLEDIEGERPLVRYQGTDGSKVIACDNIAGVVSARWTFVQELQSLLRHRQVPAVEDTWERDARAWYCVTSTPNQRGPRHVTAHSCRPARHGQIP